MTAVNGSYQGCCLCRRSLSTSLIYIVLGYWTRWSHPGLIGTLENMHSPAGQVFIDLSVS